MKTIVKKEIKQYVDEEIDITGATLLSIKEAGQLPLELREYDNWWWLRSPGSNPNLAARVEPMCPINGYGNARVYLDFGAVRPALQIKNLESSNLKIGDIFEFGGKPFKIISDNLAFCVTDIGEHCFREDWQADDANDYENSDVKKYVNDWFNGAAKEIADVTIK